MESAKQELLSQQLEELKRANDTAEQVAFERKLDAEEARMAAENTRKEKAINDYYDDLQRRNEEHYRRVDAIYADSQRSLDDFQRQQTLNGIQSESAPNAREPRALPF